MVSLVLGEFPPVFADDDAEPDAARVRAVVRNADALKKRARAKEDARQFDAAIAIYEEAIRSLRALPGDHLKLAVMLNELAFVHAQLSRYELALPLFEESVQIKKRVLKSDHMEVAAGLNNLGFLYSALGRPKDALAPLEESLAIRRRLFPGDHREVARALASLAAVHGELGRHAQALPLRQEALTMLLRLFPHAHPNVVTALNDLAATFTNLGRPQDALRLEEAALAMSRRLFPGDHRHVARAASNLASTHRDLGNPGAALPLLREALSMLRRLFPGDHEKVATCLDSLAGVHGDLARYAEALALHQEALAMARRIHGTDHPRVGQHLNNVACALAALGRPHEALARFQEALAIGRRVHPAAHPFIAATLVNVASATAEVGRAEEALALHREALGLHRRAFPEGHPDTLSSLNGLARTLVNMGQSDAALPLLEEALAMAKHLYPGDHPDVALTLTNLAAAHQLGGRAARAQAVARKAVHVADRTGWVRAYVPRVLLGELLLAQRDFEGAIDVLLPAAESVEAQRRQGSLLTVQERTELQRSLLRSDPFMGLVRAFVAMGRADRALEVLERSRGRVLLDVLAQGRQDPLRVAKARAHASGDSAQVARIEQAHRAVRDAEVALGAARVALERRGDYVTRRAIRAAHEAHNRARRAHAAALRTRLAVIRESLPEGRPRSTAQLQAMLGEDEVLLTYLLGERPVALLVSRDRVRAFPLRLDAPASPSGDWRQRLDEYTAALSTPRGTPPLDAGQALFRTLVPEPVWASVRDASQLFLVPYGPLHGLPFEALVVEQRGGQPLYWIDRGPPIAYGASASVLAWLRDKPRGTLAAARVVAVADPAFDRAPPWPVEGVLVRSVAPMGQAATVGVRPGDVITSYGGQPVRSYEDLVAAIRAGAAKNRDAPLVVDRDGTPRTVMARPGPLGLELAHAAPAHAGPKYFPAARVERDNVLPPLPGTRSEVLKIGVLLARAHPDTEVVTLVGARATEGALFEAVDQPRVLHLATHGRIDPRQGAREAALVLAPSRVSSPDNDGLLTLGDLFERWRGRLRGTSLVVLSACDTQTGRPDEKEGMLALPWGFCFAGARSAVASLWPVDDRTTRDLMAATYERLAADDEFRPCRALHRARRVVRRENAHPYFWAPFVFVGAP